MNLRSSSAGFEADAADFRPSRSRYALSSTSASNRASLPKGVGSTLSRLVFSFSVDKDRAVLRTCHNSSSSKTFIDLRASGLSFVGRISDKMTSAEREQRYSGTEYKISFV